MFVNRWGTPAPHIKSSPFFLCSAGLQAATPGFNILSLCFHHHQILIFKFSQPSNIWIFTDGKSMPKSMNPQCFFWRSCKSMVLCQCSPQEVTYLHETLYKKLVGTQPHISSHTPHVHRDAFFILNLPIHYTSNWPILDSSAQLPTIPQDSRGNLSARENTEQWREPWIVDFKWKPNSPLAFLTYPPLNFPGS